MATMIKSLSSIFCFLSLLSLLFFTSQAISQPYHMNTFCSLFSDNFTQVSSYQTNRESVLSSLRLSSSLETYSNVTTGLSPDTVHGMFLCRGDINKTSCSDCVQTATLEIARNCTNQKEAFIFYQECMVRYSDYSFFTLVEDRPATIRYALYFAPNADRFGQILSDKMDDLIIKASSSSSYFAEDKERVTQLEESYDLDSMVQCSPDLDSRNCTVCLKLAVKQILDSCWGALWARIFTPKCLLRYDVLPLPSPPPPPPPPPPPSPPLLLPSPPFFPRPAPSIAGSFSVNDIKGNEIFGRIFVAVMTACVLAFLGDRNVN